MSFWHDIPKPIIGLSPMDGVTAASFRLMAAKHGGPDITVTEFVNVDALVYAPHTLIRDFAYAELERPIIAQIYGHTPERFYQAAHVVCELGFDGLDINMGCPAKNVAASGSGAGLIRTPDLAHEIMRAARQGIADWAAGQTLESVGLKPARIAAIQRMNQQRLHARPLVRQTIPSSVKTRLGYDAVIVDRWIEHLLAERPAVISLHGRTLQQMYRGEADWRAIARAADVVRGSDTFLLGNGDVQSLSDGMRRVRETGVDGVLVGRAVLGMPWFFRQKEAARLRVDQTEDDQGVRTWEPTLETRFEILLDHACRFEALCGRNQFRRMRKHLGWYCKGFPHAAALRAKMFRVSSVAEVEAALTQYYAAGSATVAESARS